MNKKKHNFLFQCGSKMGDRAPDFKILYWTIIMLVSTENWRTREAADTHEQKKLNLLFQCGSKMGDRAKEHISLKSSYVQLTQQLLQLQMSYEY
jgi:hypothetical protein